jgi:hypothetical protein
MRLLPLSVTYTLLDESIPTPNGVLNWPSAANAAGRMVFKIKIVKIKRERESVTINLRLRLVPNHISTSLKMICPSNHLKNIRY